jgi:hypothetical protein
MSFELIHTSVVRDLDGRSGFGVAAMTHDLPRPLRDALVARSDGSELGATADRAISYAVCHAGGAAWPVLTCVTRCGVDWSGRANRVAHHLVLEPSDRCIEGPIALARAFPFASDVPEVGVRPTPVLPQPLPEQRAAHGIDPAWLDRLADGLSVPDGVTVSVRPPDGLDPLVLLAAVTARVEPKRRWAVQWSTAPAFHAGRGLPSIVIAREHDAHAIDLSGPAPAPRIVESPRPADSVSTLQRPPAPEPIAGDAVSLRPASGGSISSTRSRQTWRVERTAHEPVASTPAKPWLPIALFAVAGLIMLVALGLLLW